MAYFASKTRDFTPAMIEAQGKYRNVTKELNDAYMGGSLSEQAYIKALETGSGGAGPVFDPSKGPQIDMGGGPVPYTGQNVMKDAMGNPTIGPSASYGTAPSDPYKMTKEQFAKTLEHGSDPRNIPSTIEKSTAYEVSKKISGLIPSQTRALSPDSGAPFPNLPSTPPSFDATAEEEKLAKAYGLDELTTQASFLDDQISKIQNDLIAKQGSIAEQPISSRVMGKEASAETKKANAMLRDLRLQRGEVTRSISTANKAISMMMSAEKTDFSNAKSMWEFEYNKNISYYNNLDKTSTAQEKTDKATLQGMLNMLATGKTKIDELTPDAQNTIDQLIMSSYGPEFLGFQNEIPSGMAIYRKSFVGADGKKYLQSLYANPDGTFKVEYTNPVKTGAGASKNADAENMAAALGGVVGTDGRVSPENWKKGMDAWVAAGHSATSFASQFKNYTPGDLLK